MSDVSDSFVVERLRVKIALAMVIKKWKGEKRGLSGKSKKVLSECIKDIQKTKEIISINHKMPGPDAE